MGLRGIIKKGCYKSQEVMLRLCAIPRGCQVLFEFLHGYENLGPPHGLVLGPHPLEFPLYQQPADTARAEPQRLRSLVYGYQ